MNYRRPDEPGELIGQRYTPVRQLREEPWGAVWLARDQILEAEVGLKLLTREAPEWAAAQKIFEQEAVQALKLRHPQILGVFYLGKTDRILYLVQEPFLGETLLAQLTRQHHISLPQALHLLEHLSQAVAFGHQRGVVHRALSPLHILLQGEELRLANFAFPPPDGDQVMHLELKAYEPPEVLQGDALTPAGNVFSLGVLGFRLAAGSLPYPLTFDEPFPYRLETPPVDLEEIPLPLQNFLLQCLAVDPEERLPDAGAFLTQLRQVREQMRPRRQGNLRRLGGGQAAPGAPGRGPGRGHVGKTPGRGPAPGTKGGGGSPGLLANYESQPSPRLVGAGAGGPYHPAHHWGAENEPAGRSAAVSSGSGQRGRPGAGGPRGRRPAPGGKR